MNHWVPVNGEIPRASSSSASPPSPQSGAALPGFRQVTARASDAAMQLWMQPGCIPALSSVNWICIRHLSSPASQKAQIRVWAGVSPAAGRQATAPVALVGCQPGEQITDRPLIKQRCFRTVSATAKLVAGNCTFETFFY